MTAVLLITFLVLLLFNVPIAFCMLLSSLAALLYADINPIMVALETTRSLSNFYSFLAVPFFILAGEIMSQGGLSMRLISFVKSFLGHKKKWSALCNYCGISVVWCSFRCFCRNLCCNWRNDDTCIGT